MALMSLVNKKMGRQKDGGERLGQFENVTCTEESCHHRICGDMILMYK